MSDYVLITRPAADAVTLAQEVDAKGFTPLIEPLLVIKDIPFDIEGDYAGLVFTSANGVRAAAEMSGRREHTVYCVGDHTAAVARACGWGAVKSAGGDVAALEALLDAEGFPDGAKLLYLSGCDISRNIVLNNVSVDRKAVYKAEPVAALSAGLVDAIARGQLAAALFFSARTAAAFAELALDAGVEHGLWATKSLCLADSVVECVRHLPWRDVQVAERPERTALMALLDEIQD